MSKGNKKPIVPYNPSSDKTPRIQFDPNSFDQMNFIWRVNDSYIDYHHDTFGWCNCDTVELLKNIIKELQTYEGMTWALIKRDRHNHSWEINKIPKNLRDRLNELNLHLDEVFQIHLGSLCRVWGYRKMHVFYLIWYDPDHEGYKTKAK